MRRFLAGVALIVGCGKSDSMSQNNPDAASADASAPAGFVALIGRSWTLQAGQTDLYECVRVQIPADMYISAYRADAPVGTHHTVLTTSTTASPLGNYDCNAGALDYQMLFASGVGTDDLVFPDGVGFKLTGGQYINLNLHLFNATDNPLTGTTTIYVKPLASPPAQDAEMVFSGTVLNISIPNDGQPHTATGGCTLDADSSIIALWPHMHQTAVHQLVQLTPAGTSTPNALLDDDYAFAEQKNYPQSPVIAVHANDKLSTTCTYVNHTTINPMKFGESSLDEMCFTGIYRFPAENKGLLSCVDNGTIQHF